MATVSREPGSITPEGRIVRVVDPQNEEFDVRRLDQVLTPNDQFYIRTHGNTPDLDPTSWRLAVTGLVERPLSLALADLQAMQRRDETATLQCAGDRRTFQDPVPGGVPWRDGAVSTARWGGVPLAAVLRQAGIRPAGTYVVLEGADTAPTDAGRATFARALPIDLALAESTLIALTMNGEPLPREHGAPARVVVPRYYAMNSIKWLTRLHVQAEPFTGHFQVNDYRLWYGDDDPGTDLPPQRVMSVIAAPRGEQPIPAGRTRIHGAAWTGTGTVQQVEVSPDGGRSWQPATFTSEATPGVWRLWECWWDATPGEHTLLSRAADSEGNRQPDALPPNRKGYANNFVLPIAVKVQ